PRLVPVLLFAPCEDEVVPALNAAVPLVDVEVLGRVARRAEVLPRDVPFHGVARQRRLVRRVALPPLVRLAGDCGAVPNERHAAVQRMLTPSAPVAALLRLPFLASHGLSFPSAPGARSWPQ